MSEPSAIHGKRLAMIAWGTKPDGSDDVAVFTGLAEWDGLVLTVRRQPDSASFVIPAKWLPRLKPVEDGLRETLLDAEFCFSVSVGNLGADEDASGFHETGLKWPGDEDAG
jgi:hypothetical protein